MPCRRMCAICAERSMFCAIYHDRSIVTVCATVCGRYKIRVRFFRFVTDDRIRCCATRALTTRASRWNFVSVDAVRADRGSWAVAKIFFDRMLHRPIDARFCPRRRTRCRTAGGSGFARTRPPPKFFCGAGPAGVGPTGSGVRKLTSRRYGRAETCGKAEVTQHTAEVRILLG